MKLTYSWLKDFVDIKISPRELADKLTMAGLEVVSFETRGDDALLEIEITSNRPDWLSVIGVAREIAAVTGAKIKRVASCKLQATSKTKKKFSIEIESKKDCPLYTAKIIRGVKVGASPEWLRKRLESIGCRSVNNLVDITNYILFTYGAPLHAFDLDKLSGEKIVVRRGHKGEKLTAIDGAELLISAEALVIADAIRPVAVAGIMGGEDSEVTGSTRNILLEAAVFEPGLVRRGKKILGLFSESAYRFERSVPVELSIEASARAAAMIRELCGGECVFDSTPAASKIKKNNIVFSLINLSQALGVEIPAPKVKSILNSLGFEVKNKGKSTLSVGVPYLRQDVHIEADLVEEVARIYGFSSIPTTLPRIKPRLLKDNNRCLTNFTKNILIGLGLNEVITYSLMDKDSLAGFCSAQELEQVIGVANPLSKEQEILRPALLASLSSRVAYNLNQKQEFVGIFEVSHVFSNGFALGKEKVVLGIALCGTRKYFFEDGVRKEEVSLLHLKGIAETLLQRLGIKEYAFKQDNLGSAGIYIKEEKIGKLLTLDRQLMQGLDIKNKEVFLLEVCLDKALSFVPAEKQFVALPRYPGITRDISLLLKENISLDKVFAALREKGLPLLKDVKVTDYYKGKQIPDGFRGLTISCIYLSLERTLTESEVGPLHDFLCNILTGQFSAKIR